MKKLLATILVSSLLTASAFAQGDNFGATEDKPTAPTLSCGGDSIAGHCG